MQSFHRILTYFVTWVHRRKVLIHFAIRKRSPKVSCLKKHQVYCNYFDIVFVHHSKLFWTHTRLKFSFLLRSDTESWEISPWKYLYLFVPRSTLRSLFVCFFDIVSSRHLKLIVFWSIRHSEFPNFHLSHNFC